MCTKAVEIQKLWAITRPSDGDFIYFTDYRQSEAETAVLSYHDCCCGDSCTDPVWNYDLDGLIWLPRQDQLQEIAEWGDPFELFAVGVGVVPQELHDGGYLDEDSREYKYYSKFNSFEKLWLALIMAEKYNKKWNGEVWQ